jgi:hypothetical protein
MTTQQQQQYITVPLSYPLPGRNWCQLPNGKWFSKEWTPATKAEAELGRVKQIPAQR